MKTFEIETRKGAKKGRSFRATLAGSLSWGQWVSEKNPQHHARPVWMLWLGTQRELRAFFANLRMGRTATMIEGTDGWNQLSLPKTVRYQIRWTGEGSAEMFAVDLFSLAFTDENGYADLALCPPKAWLKQQGPDQDQTMASLLAAYLDRRTAAPLLRVPEFHRALYDAAQDDGYLAESERACTFTRGDGFFHDSGFEALPFRKPLRFSPPRNLDEYLIHQTEIFLKENPHHGKTGIFGARGILSDADGAGEQLRLFSAA